MTFTLLVGTNLLSISILIGNALNLSIALLKCWFDKIVVGHNNATCLPLIIALKMALNATSVLPYPTSPHNNLSIGRSFSISFLISAIAFNWSSVSVYGNSSSNSYCSLVSFKKAKPFVVSLIAYNFNNSPAISWILFLAFNLVLCHSVLPSLFSFGVIPSLAEYLLIKSIFSTGIYNLSSSLYDTIK